MGKRALAVGAIGTAAVAAAATGIAVGRNMKERWGVDAAASVRPMPGDDLVATPDAVDTRVIDIDAPVDKVWPWLVQMGYGRAGWYSYDVLDMNEPSALGIEERWQTLAVDDIMPTHPGGGFVVKVLEPQRALVLYLDRAIVEEQERSAKEAKDGKEATDETPAGMDAATANVRATGTYLGQTVSGDFAATWAFELQPRDGGGTRLVERFRIRMEAPGKAERLMRAARGFLGFGVFVMTRRQMLGIKDRAEGRFGAPRRSFPIHPGGGSDVAPTTPPEATTPPETPEATVETTEDAEPVGAAAPA